MGKIVSQDELVQIAAREKRDGRRVVFTNGCFDLLHPGHVRCLAEARALGDILVVAVNSDRSVRGNKGPNVRSCRSRIAPRCWPRFPRWIT